MSMRLIPPYQYEDDSEYAYGYEPKFQNDFDSGIYSHMSYVPNTLNKTVSKHQAHSRPSNQPKHSIE